MQLNLQPGKHNDPVDGVCIMEILSLATSAKLVDGAWVFRPGTSFTDLPPCTHRTVARVAQRAWDDADDEGRRRLLQFLPRLLRARRSKNRRVAIRIGLACAREVEHLAGPEAKECNDAVERWLHGEATIKEVIKARNAAAAAAATTTYAAAAAAATYAATDAADAATDAAADAAATTTYAATDAATDALFRLLDVALDAHEKAIVEEGEALWVPEPWEQEALEFVEQLVG